MRRTHGQEGESNLHESLLPIIVVDPFVIKSASSDQTFLDLDLSKVHKAISKLKILAHLDKVQLQDKGHNCESFIFGVMPLLNKIFFM